MNLHDWRLKGLVQKSLSILPGGGQVNDWLQRRGGLKDFESNISDKVGDWDLMMGYLHKVGWNCDGKSLLEIGTGWYPTLPVCLILAGAKRITTVDIVRHASQKLTFRMIGALESHLEQIAARSGRPLAAVREQYGRIRSARSLEELWSVAGIEYRSPEDAAKLNLPDNCIDIVYSNSVFEHVEPRFIAPIMREAYRLLRDDGLNVHAIACNDHYAFFDRSISFVNFLRYTEQEWRLWNNRLNYQNRLRANDFTRIVQESGFDISLEARHVRPGSREALVNMKLAPEFQHYQVEDLVTTTVDFVATKTSRPAFRDGTTDRPAGQRDPGSEH